jgi:pimeloyl-ACP methyl ester carboxylesterase
MSDAAASVLLPGLGLGAPAWWPTVSALAASGRAVDRRSVLPLPGYGLPASRRDDLRPRALAERVAGDWPPGPQRAVLMGHSASCQVAVHVAALSAERVEALVLVGPTTDPRGATWPRLVRRWLATARHEPPHQIPVLLRQYARTGPWTMARAMDAARRDQIDRAITTVGCPVLVLRGRHDAIAPPDWTARLADRPSRRAVTLAAGGHMVPLTHGGLVAAEVIAFGTAQEGAP